MLLLLPLSFAATISGTVTGDDGAPLEGVLVTAYDPQLNYATAETTSDGAFTLEGLPENAYRVRAAPNADENPLNYVTRYYPDEWDYCSGYPVEASDDVAVENVDFVLPTGGTISGRLLDPDGLPIADVYVLCGGISSRSSAFGSVVTTGEDGIFTAVALDAAEGEADNYQCVAYPELYPEQYYGGVYDNDSSPVLSVTRGEDTTMGDWQLLPGILVQGTITGGGEPVVEGDVFVYSTSQVKQVAIAEDGTYEAVGMPPGDVIVWASSSGFATTYYPDSDRPGESYAAYVEGAEVTLDLELPEENTLTIQFLGEGELSEVSVLLYNDTFTVGRGIPLDEDGIAIIDALHPGSYYLYVYGTDAGYVSDFLRNEDGSEMAIAVEGDSTVEVSLAPAATLSGHIYDEEGDPLFGSLAAAFPRALADDGSGYGAAVDTDGSFSLSGLPSGDNLLRASFWSNCPNDPGYVTEWWSEAWVEEEASLVESRVGEEIGGYDFRMLHDDDHDQMGDTWEVENGLEPEVDDGALDLDGDGYTNLQEWQLGTNPNDEIVEQPCGCGDGKEAGGLLLLLGLGRRGRRRTP